MTIYCIIARDRTSGDEWVMPKTVETILEAGEIMYHYKAADPRFAYRIDGIEPKPLPTEHRTEDFTLTELFGWYEGKNASGSLKECSECGGAISDMEVHRTWHNKLIP